MTIAERNEKMGIFMSETCREEIREWAKTHTISLDSFHYVDPGLSTGTIFDVREDCRSMFASRASCTPLLEKPK